MEETSLYNRALVRGMFSSLLLVLFGHISDFMSICLIVCIMMWFSGGNVYLKSAGGASTVKVTDSTISTTITGMVGAIR